jgi:acetolactate decarboxylase
MISFDRRHLLRLAIGGGCAICTALAGRAARGAEATTPPTVVQGPGYVLRYIGALHAAIMQGQRAAILDLATLRDVPRFYGLGPIEGLAGEVTIIDSRPSLARVRGDRAIEITESFDAGVPFFVWAEVPRWRTVPLPAEVRSYADLEAFVGRAATAANIAGQPFPFLVRGRPALIDFHVVNARPDTPAGMEAHDAIKVPFHLRGQDVTLIGFYSSDHHGVFTPMGSNVHIHFQTSDNTRSGHVEGLQEISAGNATLALPAA